MPKPIKINNEHSSLYQSVFGSVNGKKVLEDLERELNPDILFVKGDADETLVNIGKRDAFIYIKSFVEE